MRFVETCISTRSISSELIWKHVVSKVVDGKWIVDSYWNDFTKASNRVFELSQEGF